ncbi:MAG: CRISPR-associated endonuclease Cas1, partial [Gammaproteobacteria bacterium]|nr:CRISPR-associated endonuclease Cas1 [Gammaproteobacteria bacterium]
MSTLYLDRKNVQLSVSGGQLLVREPEAKLRSIPLKLLERVVIRHATQMESTLLGVLAEAGVALLCLSARNGRRTAMVLGAGHNDARRRLAQYRLALDEAARLRLAKRLMVGKVAAQQRVLMRALAERADLNLPLQRGIKQLQQRWVALWECEDLESLRGQEGAAAAAYFKAYQTLFAPSLEFNGRNRRPPRDPVNGVLSLGYTLLHFNAVQAAHGAGLDPLLGFYHEPSYGRESLACDVMEPLRPRLDRW